MKFFADPSRALRGAVFGAAALLYLPAVFILPFSDDWQISAWAQEHRWNLLFPAENFRLFTRALAALGHALLLERINLLITPVSIAALLATAVVLTHATRRLAPGLPAAPVVVAVLYLAHPGNVAAVIQVDTLSQALADLFGVAAVYQIVFVAPPARVRDAAAGFALALMALLGKESALGVLAAIPFAVALRAASSGRDVLRACREALPAALAIFGAIALFMVVRTAIGTPLTPAAAGRYAIHWDIVNIAINAAQLLGCSLYFGNVATLFAFGLTPATVFSGLLSATIAATACGAAWRRLRAAADPAAPSIRPGDILLWSAFALASVMPMALMGSVSDLYAAGVTPFVTVPLAILLVDAARARRHGSRALGLLVAASVAWGAAGIVEKISMRRVASERTWAFVRALDPLLDRCDVARRGVVVVGNLADTTTGGEPYSSFSVLNERIVRSVISARLEPGRAAWLARAPSARPQPGADRSDASCSARPVQAGEPCDFHCVARPTALSRPLRCRVLIEACADTRA